MSIEGMRRVTGREEPAKNGNPRRFESATISTHSSQSVERCLSLKTGTDRPDCSKTFTHSLNHW